MLIRLATTSDRVTREDVQRILTAAAESDNHTQDIGLCRASRIRARNAALACAAAQLSGDRPGPWQVPTWSACHAGASRWRASKRADLPCWRAGG